MYISPGAVFRVDSGWWGAGVVNNGSLSVGRCASASRAADMACALAYVSRCLPRAKPFEFSLTE